MSAEAAPDLTAEDPNMPRDAVGPDGADKAPSFERMVMPADAKKTLEDLQGKLEDQNARNWFQKLFSTTTNFDALGAAGDGEWIPIGRSYYKSAREKLVRFLNQI